MHPGWINTDMSRIGIDIPLLSIEESAQFANWLALDSPEDVTGKFIINNEIIEW